MRSLVLLSLCLMMPTWASAQDAAREAACRTARDRQSDLLARYSLGAGLAPAEWAAVQHQIRVQCLPLMKDNIGDIDKLPPIKLPDNRTPAQKSGDSKR
jgi:hypothetical protein